MLFTDVMRSNVRLSGKSKSDSPQFGTCSARLQAGIFYFQ
jgi:hypothetical protein